MRIVLDTNIVVGRWREHDAHCRHVVRTAREHEHRFLYCPRLMREYRRVLSRGNGMHHSTIDRLLMNTLPAWIWERGSNPEESIDFGPSEDRYHMELAINYQAAYHITRDRGVLAEAGRMAEHGVCGCHPKKYVDDLTKWHEETESR